MYYLLLDRKYLSLTIGSKNLLTLNVFYRYPYAKSVRPIRRYSAYVSFPTILAPGLRSTILSQKLQSVRVYKIVDCSTSPPPVLATSKVYKAISTPRPRGKRHRHKYSR